MRLPCIDVARLYFQSVPLVDALIRTAPLNPPACPARSRREGWKYQKMRAFPPFGAMSLI